MKQADASVATAVREWFATVAAEKDLGKMLRFSMATPPTGKRLFTAVFVMCLVGLFGLALFDPEPALVVKLLLAAGEAVFLWLLLGVILALFKGGKQFVGIYEGGFLYQGATSDLIVVPWAKVRAITRAATTMIVDGQERHTYVAIVLDTELGKTTLNEEFPDVFELSEILDRKVCETLLPDAAGKLRNGERIEFGAVAVDREGINRGAHHLPWGQVASLVFHNGKLMIGRKGTTRAWAKVPLRRLPNATLLVQLADLAKGTG